jgi:tol-pal system protein YbgF
MLVRIIKLLCLLTPVLVAGGCTLLQPMDDPVLTKVDELDRRTQVLEQAVRNQSLVNTTQQVAAVERQSDELRGRVETLENSADSAAARQRQLYADLDARIQALESAVQHAPGSVPAGSPGQGQLPIVGGSPGGSDRDNYQAAFELLKAQRYAEASTAFQQFLMAFPDSELADNAQYWLAESYYVTQRFNEALAAFEVVTNEYPRSRKLPDALLKIGYCNYELKNWDAARTALSGVRADFPESTAARLALQRLERMGEEGI